MVKVIANATNKGGEGKTTVSILLSEYAALVMQKRVLAIDLDPQANFSKYYLNIEYDPAAKGGKIPPIHPDYNQEEDPKWDGRSSIADIFHTHDGRGVMPYPSYFENIDILPAHSQKLQDAEAVTKQEVLEKVHLRVKEFISLDEVKQSYDLIIIDTPPSRGPLTIAAIKACSHMVIPAQMEEDSIEGVYGMLQEWKQESYNRTEDDPITLVGILANRVRNAVLHDNFFEQLCKKETTKDFIISYKIKERIIYGELRVKEDRPKSVFELAIDHPARIECSAACKEIMEKIFPNG